MRVCMYVHTYVHLCILSYRTKSFSLSVGPLICSIVIFFSYKLHPLWIGYDLQFRILFHGSRTTLVEKYKYKILKLPSHIC